VEGSLGSGSGWQRLRLVLGTGGLRDLAGRREHGACAIYESSALVRPYVPLLIGGSGTEGTVSERVLGAAEISKLSPEFRGDK
jgi:hypothetical protein